jgi:hypothetical protein
VASKVKIYPAAMQSMFASGGDIYKFAGDVRDDVRTLARKGIHNRTRGLWRSITSERHTLPLGVKFSVGSYSPYALYVEEGTAGDGAGFITARGLHPMVLYQNRRAPAKYARFKGVPKQRVHGQKGQHFLREGLAAGMAKHGLI